MKNDTSENGKGKAMEKIYSLKELAAMRTEVCNIIGDIIKEETKDGYRTARELAAATNGLCTPHHIANAISHCFVGQLSIYCASDSKFVPIDKKVGKITKVRHLIEVDDCGKEIRRFDERISRKGCVYKATSDEMLLNEIAKASAKFNISLEDKN